MRFINRQTENPNKKILNVQQVNYNSNTGEISSIIVDEINNDGPVLVEGTKLNADNLNSVFESLGRNFFCHYYYKELFGVDIDQDDYSIDLVGQTSKTINISYDNLQLEPTTIYNQYLTFNVINNHTLVVTKNNVDLTTPRTGKFSVSFINPIEEQELICTLSIHYSYTPNSTNPED